MPNDSPHGFDCHLTFRCTHCEDPLPTILEDECFWSREYHQCFGESPSLLAMIDADGSIDLIREGCRLDLEMVDK